MLGGAFPGVDVGGVDFSQRFAPGSRKVKAMSRPLVRSSLVGVIGLGITTAAVAAPSALVDHPAPVLRASLETAVVLVGSLVALLAFGRFRRSGQVADLSIVCAAALLAWVHTLVGLVPELFSSPSAGNETVERFEFWGAIVVRTMAAAFLLFAARKRLPGRESSLLPRSAYARVLAVAAVGVVSILLLVWWAPISRSGLIDDTSWRAVPSSILQLFGALLFFAAFLGLSREAVARSDPFLGWLAAGCVLGGFATISYALLPAGRADWLRSGDLLRAAAIGTWAMGAVAEILSYWSTIAESARKETRRGVALELHDGLAQELSLLSTYSLMPAEKRAQPQWHEQLQTTAARALAEARRAIATLANDDPASFEADLQRTVESISTDVAVRVDVDPVRGPSARDPLQRESIVRIVREAVTNAVRHGGAEHIDILYEVDGSPMLRVLDDGVGFDPTHAASSGRFGLISMRERAEAIGASLAVRSAPGQGTTVEVLWP
jgi:signal transduction histidine kinase